MRKHFYIQFIILILLGYFLDLLTGLTIITISFLPYLDSLTGKNIFHSLITAAAIGIILIPFIGLIPAIISSANMTIGILLDMKEGRMLFFPFSTKKFKTI